MRSLMNCLFPCLSVGSILKQPDPVTVKGGQQHCAPNLTIRNLTDTKSLLVSNNQNQIKEPDPHSPEFDHRLIPEPITVPKVKLRSLTTPGGGGFIPPKPLDLQEGKERFHLRSCRYYCQETGDWRLLSSKTTNVH